jgi:hypothetical protein
MGFPWDSYSLQSRTRRTWPILVWWLVMIYVFNMVTLNLNDLSEVKLPEGSFAVASVVCSCQWWKNHKMLEASDWKPLESLAENCQDISGCSSGTSTPFLGTKYYRRHGRDFWQKDYRKLNITIISWFIIKKQSLICRAPETRHTLPGQENYDAAKAVSKPPGFSIFWHQHTWIDCYGNIWWLKFELGTREFSIT